MILPWKHERITFEQFMDFCLYDPQFGYYRKKHKIFGPEGDYYTAPYTHEMFAHTLADAFVHYYELCSRSQPFHLVELGAGEGVLAQAILARLEQCCPQLHKSMEYVPVELRTPLPERIQGVVFSNEFFDALPVHRVCILASQVHEIFVEINDEISECEGQISDARIFDYMKQGFRQWREGYEYEVNLRMVEVMEDLDRRIDKGVVLTLDYGYEWEEYDAKERSSGTLICYHRHRAIEDPYVNLGEQDITAHVNFEVMRSVGDRLGWRSESLKTQRQFLLDWGLESRLLEEESRGLLNPARVEQRLGLKSLLVPGGISDTVKVLVQKVRLD